MANDTEDKSKIGIGGDMQYLQALLERYGGDTDVGTVWKGEQERLAIIPPLKLQRDVKDRKVNSEDN